MNYCLPAPTNMMKALDPILPIMKLNTLATILPGLLLFASTPAPAPAADLSQLIANTAKWESGQSQEPLRKFEQLARESAGKKKERAQLEAALVKLLGPDCTFEARRFACQQLSVVGSDSSVSAIAKLLKDGKTVGIACLAFGKRPSSKADKALLTALSAAQGEGRLQIISTLGDRRVARAVKALAELAQRSDAAAADTAIRALGKIANEAASRALADLRKRTALPFSDSLADASLRCAAALAGAGNHKAAAAICQELLASSQSAHVRRGGFKGLLATDGDGGEQRILQTIRGSDSVLKPVAIAAVAGLRNPNASETFGRELPALSAEAQIWLIDALVVRADAPARAAILGRMDSADAAVRLAAAAALGRVGGATAVKPLAKALASARDDDEVRALQSALADLPDDRDTDKAIVNEMKSAQGETRARLITSLATRRNPQIITALFQEAESKEDLVATAAYRVLARAGTGANLPQLLKQFASLPNTDLRSDVEGFVQQAIVATDDVSLRSKAVCDALDQAASTEVRCALLNFLPYVGDDRSLKALLAAVNGTEARARDNGVHALSEWPDMAAWDALYAIFRKPVNEAYRSITLRSLVRLLGDANAHPDDQLIAHYRELLEGARDAADLKQILGALGGAAHPEALTLATAQLNKPGVQAEAQVAVNKITEALKAKPRGAAK